MVDKQNKFQSDIWDSPYLILIGFGRTKTQNETWQNRHSPILPPTTNKMWYWCSAASGGHCSEQRFSGTICQVEAPYMGILGGGEDAINVTAPEGGGGGNSFTAPIGAPEGGGGWGECNATMAEATLGRACGGGSVNGGGAGAGGFASLDNSCGDVNGCNDKTSGCGGVHGCADKGTATDGAKGRDKAFNKASRGASNVAELTLIVWLGGGGATAGASNGADNVGGQNTGAPNGGGKETGGSSGNGTANAEVLAGA
jgi:hypothetical protein